LGGRKVDEFSDIDIDGDGNISKTEFDTLAPFNVVEKCPPVPWVRSWVQVMNPFPNAGLLDAEFYGEQTDGTWDIHYYYEKMWITGTQPSGKRVNVPCSIISIPKTEGYEMWTGYKPYGNPSFTVPMKNGDPLACISKSTDAYARIFYFKGISDKNGYYPDLVSFDTGTIEVVETSFSAGNLGKTGISLFSPQDLVPVITYKGKQNQYRWRNKQTRQMEWKTVSQSDLDIGRAQR
jgi:hypothetical protein